MADLAPPSIVGPVLAGAAMVRVTGVVARAGAHVDVTVRDATGTIVGTWSAAGGRPTVDVVVGAVYEGYLIEAQQTWEARHSSQSIATVVSASPDPATVKPVLLAPEVDRESRGVRVLGAIPGWPVSVEEVATGRQVALGAAGPDGVADLRIDLSSTPLLSTIAARHPGGGGLGPSSTVVYHNPPLEPPHPVIPPPCSSFVALNEVTPGSTVLVNLITPLAAPRSVGAIAYGTQVDVWFGEELEDEDIYSAQASWDEVFDAPGVDRDSAYAKFSPSETRGAVGAVEVEGVWVGATTLIVTGQYPGAMVTVAVSDASGGVLFELERGGTADPAFPLTLPLAAGQTVSCSQTLCTGGVAQTTAGQVAVPAPESVTPVLVGPLFDCGMAVTVAGTTVGAFVEVLEDGFVAGAAWATGLATVVQVAPALREGQAVTARQTFLGVVGPLSAVEAVSAVPAELATPRILQPLVVGDDRVWVVGVTPGSRVQVLDRSGDVKGEVVASESIVEVAVSGIRSGGWYHPSVFLCDRDAMGEEVAAVADIEGGPFPVYEGTFRLDGGSLVLLDPALGIDPGAVVGYGQAYVPSNYKTVPPRALAIIVHGTGDGAGYVYPETTTDLGAERPPDHFGNPLGGVVSHPPDPNTSYLGYGWLGTRLASHGVHVYSLRIDQHSLTVPERLEIARAYLNRLREDAASCAIAFGPVLIGLPTFAWADSSLYAETKTLVVGHSNGAEAGLILAEDDDPLLCGVVAFAPSRNEGPRPNLRVPFLQVNGSDDGFFTGGSPTLWTTANFLDDTTIRPRAWLWVPKAAHDDWNTEWYVERYTGHTPAGLWAGVVESPERGRIDGSTTRDLTLPIVMAFLLDRLGDSRWKGWLDGITAPASHRGQAVALRHWPASGPGGAPVVIDDFGPSGAPEPMLNALGQPVTWNVPDVPFSPEQPNDADLHDVDKSDSVHAPEARVVHLAWSGSNLATAFYATEVKDAFAGVDGTRDSLRLAMGLLHAPPVIDPATLEQIPNFAVGGPPLPVDSTMFQIIGDFRDVRIRVTDVHGNSATVRAGAIRLLPYPAESLPGELDTTVVDGVIPGEISYGYRMALQDWTIPLDAFLGVNPALDLAAVCCIEVLPMATSAWLELGLVEVDS